MAMNKFKAERSGTEFGVSYVLKCEDQKCSFRRYPDIIIHMEDIGAGRMLVCTGEIQSTNLPSVQNSIYGVGSLVRNRGRRLILCLTFYKNKSAQLLVARLTSHLDPEDKASLGTVSLKFVGSSAPVDLFTVEGLKTFSSRLHFMLNKL